LHNDLHGWLVEDEDNLGTSGVDSDGSEEWLPSDLDDSSDEA
jgi:hypothetical protein